MKRLLAAALLCCIAAPAQAHEVWIERDGDGAARIYLGEPAEALPAGGDPEFANLKAPRILSALNAAPARKAGYLEVAVPAGDVRAWDDGVFKPWGPEGKKEGVVYYARAGRSETGTGLPFEIAPVAADGDRFVLLRDGRPVADTEVTIVSPDKWTRKLRTDAVGSVAVPTRGAGRYLLSASLKDEGVHKVAGGDVAVLHRITTTTFVAR